MNIDLRITKDRNFELASKSSAIFISILCIAIFMYMLVKSIPAFHYYYLYVGDLKPQEAIYKAYNEHKEKLVKEIPGYYNLKDKIISSGYIKLSYQVKQSINNNNAEDYIKSLYNSGKIVKKYDFSFFYSADSAYPEFAGIKNAIIGTLKVIFLTIIITTPIGVLTGIFLEELCINRKIKSFLETCVNILIGIPSVIYGILGLAIFVEISDMPRASVITASLTLSLMALPLVIISTRQTLQSIPESIRLAALALGASKMQMILHHLVRLSLPGIASGIILSLIRIIGETAPLMVIGMVAFIRNKPESIFEPTSALPVQIYLWSSNIDKGFEEKVFAAICTLIIIMCLLNITIHKIRRIYERKW